MVKRNVSISLRVDVRDLDEYEKKVRTEYNPTGQFSSLSECLRELSKIGNKVMDYQELMKDPEKAEEFRIKMQEMLQTQSMDEWSQTLSTEQLDGFLTFLQIEKEKRFEQKKFL